ncbi:class I SAM-dependent methyltransferase [Sphingomonas sp. KR1UV-12]|uniref:Class I SAM-dependent methyltransferase n=1 Tax=Sphingomonas aurea TaxID=3063994 RepID=A0ABT9EPB3_9SPHN|nr:class I SAM-dependent methyltransferase [Sphingomonas sp. KR1UV-12]MDP1028796.1 class I SAM-dependent methyltransferase [Sphingomonas sp. KR1UV-12]
MNCRHCGAAVRLPLIDLGASPPSNAYLSGTALSAPETWYPLRVAVCEACWLVQTEDFAGRDAFFSEDYAYFSSFSTSWLRHSEAYVAAMAQRLGLDGTSLVVEVAANDGYLLQYVAARGIGALGIEPTASTAQAARAKGLEIVEDFFGTDLARRLVAEGRSADLTAANNVLAHVPDINDFVAGFALLLKPDGVSTFEFPHLLNLIEQRQFDTIYHEHYSYLSLTAVATIFAANGLAVFDVEELPTHGGSLRVHAQRADTGARPVGLAVAAMLAREAEAGIATPGYYAALQGQAEEIADALNTFLIQARAEGLKVAGYGAAAKGNTLLNFAGIRPHLLPFVVDRNPAKAGRFLPGSRVPVVDEARLRAERPDHVLILPWNIADEVMEQLSYIRDWGGRFVTAVPELRIA